MAYAEICYRPGGNNNDEEIAVTVGSDNDSPDAQTDATNRTRELFRNALADVLEVLGTETSTTERT